jgi:YgiT-type zinc finger domain-containing protein
MIPCSECNIGQMHKTHVTYFTWMKEQLITVPDFPAWVCDICGKREYDLEAVNQLALLLSPVNAVRKQRSHRVEQAQEQPQSKPHISQS